MGVFVFLALAVPFSSATADSAGTPDPKTALLDYIRLPDPAYSWRDTGARLTGVTNHIGWTGYVINLTSQAWLTTSEVKDPVWTHKLVVVVSNQSTSITKSGVGGLWVTGGTQTQHIDAKSEDIIVAASMAVDTGLPCASLFQVPNQPISFVGDDVGGRGETTLLPYTWSRYLHNLTQPNWVILLPMVKSAVRAMDAFSAFAKQQGLGGGTIDRFAVVGASKRGWTTWLTGAVDPRVISIVPIVMDLLNTDVNILHQYKAYGGWSFVMKNYRAFNITRDFGELQVVAPLLQILDPLNYKANLTMPKLVVDATGDEFFALDDDHYWWGELLGETKRLMVQNAEHSMLTGFSEAVAAISTFLTSVVMKTSRPTLSWTMDPSDGKITLHTSRAPSKVTLWMATTLSTTRRDFRLITGNTPANPCKYIPVKIFGDACLTPLLWWGEAIAAVPGTGNMTFEASQPLPPSGWRGFFLEVFFPFTSGADVISVAAAPPAASTPFRFTTQVSIIPNTFPFPSCRSLPQGCEGVLV